MKSIYSLIGKTKLVYLEHFSKEYQADIFVKLECKNPASSVKDRPAFAMLKDAVERGLIKENGTIIEPTSGNTGIGLAFASKLFKLNTLLVMPESMSLERRLLLQAYGAKLVLTDAKKGMQGAVDKAKELVEQTENSYMPDQFSNPQCINAHYETTAVEIDQDLEKEGLSLDAFIAGVGTGGTISGVGIYFKQRNKKTQIIAVEPSTSAVLSGEKVGVHGIQGIGAGFVPGNFKREVVDSIIKVSTEEAIEFGKLLIEKEGISCGISAGANIAAVVKYAKNLPKSNRKKCLLTIIPDSIEKYLSTKLVQD